jgi:hypothetical protein
LCQTPRCLSRYPPDRGNRGTIVVFEGLDLSAS